jgi:DNA-binding MarR family transcriptional regulator
MRMNLNRYISRFISLFFLFSSVFAFAQGPKAQERMEDIEAMKVAFITKKLSLTPEEAQSFWPVYNAYSDKLKELRKKRRQDMKTAQGNVDEMSDKEVEAAVDNEITFRQKELDLQKEYHAKFKTVLPIKKVAKLYSAEEQFKKVLLDKLKDKPN